MPSSLKEIQRRIIENRGAPFPEIYHPANLIKPELLADGEKAANRLAKGLLHRQRMVIVSDFDADGATGGALFIRGLRMLATALGEPSDLHYVIPDRFKYGYGLKPELAEDAIRPLDPAIVITIDNGISSQSAVHQMKSWPSAPTTIITDHHQPGETLPAAFAVVNPNREDCSFPSKALCGCGVAFYLLLLVRRALIELAPTQERKSAVSKVKLIQLADLVAVATIGDVVPMDANNRLLVKIGLDRINKGMTMSPREAHKAGLLSMGVRALLEKAGAELPITSTDLAFKVVPRINAIGRLEEPTAGIECLLAESWTIAQLEAEKCDKANNERKSIQRTMSDQAERMLMEKLGAMAGKLKDMPAVVLHNDKWHPGVVGLTASKIKEQTRGAVICFSPDGDPTAEAVDSATETLKGSGRSDNVHLRDALALVATWNPELRMQFGGHARAAGLSLHRDDLDTFRASFAKAVAHLLTLSPLENRTWIDGELPASSWSMELAEWIEQQPWGQMFPEPTFRQAFLVAGIRQMKGPHLKLTLQDARIGGQGIEMVWFNSMTNRDTLPFEAGDIIAADYRLTVNRWNGQRTLQGIIQQAKRFRTRATTRAA